MLTLGFYIAIIVYEASHTKILGDGISEMDAGQKRRDSPFKNFKFFIYFTKNQPWGVDCQQWIRRTVTYSYLYTKESQ